MSRVNLKEQTCEATLRLRGIFIGFDENSKLLDLLMKFGEQRKDKFIIDLKNVGYLDSTSPGVRLSAHTSNIRLKTELFCPVWANPWKYFCYYLS